MCQIIILNTVCVYSLFNHLVIWLVSNVWAIGTGQLRAAQVSQLTFMVCDTFHTNSINSILGYFTNTHVLYLPKGVTVQALSPQTNSNPSRTRRKGALSPGSVQNPIIHNAGIHVQAVFNTNGVCGTRIAATIARTTSNSPVLNESRGI